MFFNTRVDIREGADSSGNRTGGDFLARRQKAFLAAVELGIGFRHLQAEGDGLSMDAVGPADTHRILVFHCAALESAQQRIHVLKKDIGRLDKLDIEACVQNVRGRHALVHETGVRSDNFSQMGEESDDVVLGFALDFVNAVDIECRVAALFPDRCGGFLRDDAEVRKRIAGMGLDLEPDTEFRFRRPDGNHVGTGIARDHRGQDLMWKGIWLRHSRGGRVLQCDEADFACSTR